MEAGAVIAALLTLIVMYKVLFGDKEEFFECIKFWLIPDILSMARGQYWEDHWAELKLIIWLGSGFAVGYWVYHL